ncbi:MAG: hypothetical protein JW981_04595 [Anaerolineae bacterium]|nr:hypothetical protein [Anaerolineae bacterium]
METEIFAERWLWLIISIGLSLIVSWVSWILHQIAGLTAPDDNALLLPKLQTWLDNIDQWPASGYIWQALRIVYALGIPTLALFWRGALTEKGLGLQKMPWNTLIEQPADNLANWATDTGWAIVIAAIAGSVGWWSQRRHTMPTTSLIQPEHDLGIAVREAIYHQVHWAFYREPFVLLWGMETGTWIGLLPVVFEALVNPRLWKCLNNPAHGQDVLNRATLAIVGTLLYLKTQNLWLALIVDTGLGWFWGYYKKNG